MSAAKLLIREAFIGTGLALVGAFPEMEDGSIDRGWSCPALLSVSVWGLLVVSAGALCLDSTRPRGVRLLVCEMQRMGQHDTLRCRFGLGKRID